MNPERGVIAIFGPTGSGKTDIAVHVARALRTAVVNCDPAQCYDVLPTLTNKPGAEHDEIAEHRLIGCWPPSHESTVGEFARQAHHEIDQLIADKGTAVACGGSGLYLRAALSELDLAAGPADPEIRRRIEHRYDSRGGTAVHAHLATVDPEAAAAIHPNDRKRVVRALEANELGSSVTRGGSLWNAPYRWPTTVVVLDVPRETVRARIDARTQRMFDDGVLDEVAALIGAAGEFVDRLSSTAQVLHGLSDCRDVLAGHMSQDEGREKMAARTRQYARRQDTWGRRWAGAWRVQLDGSTEPQHTATLIADEWGTHAL